MAIPTIPKRVATVNAPSTASQASTAPKPAAPKPSPGPAPGAAPTAPATNQMMAGGKYRLGGGDPAKLGFELVPTKNTKRSLFLVVVGRNGTGKNTLAYSAIEEGPVFEISIVERGTEGDSYMQRYTSRGIHRKVLMPDMADPLSPLISERMFEEARRIVYSMYGVKGTLIINTSEELYEIGRMAINQKLEKVMQRDYGPINRAMNDLFSPFMHPDCPTNLILISKGSDLYVNGERTDMMEYKGWKNALFMSDGMVFLNKNTYGDGSDKRRLTPLPIAERITGTIVRSPADLQQEGQILKGDKLNFVELKRRMLAL